MEGRELPRYRLVICREDLPMNSSAEELHYPAPYCWDVAELMKRASEEGRDSPLWQEARRIYFEALHRSWGTYKRGRPFFDVYMCDVEKGICLRLNKEDPAIQRLVIMEIIASAFEFGIGVRGAGVFREFLGRPIARTPQST